MGDERLERGMRVSILMLAANLLLAMAKGLAGILGQSTALISDAVHSASDSLSTVTVLAGLKIAHQPADENHHYGHAKIESVSAKIVAIILVVTGLGVGWAALRAVLAGPVDVPGVVALWVAFASVLAKEGMYRYTIRAGKQLRSSALTADAWHHRSDALSSVTALVGVIGARVGFPLLDPIAGMVVALLILRMGGKLYWQSVEELVDTAPDQETVSRIVGVTRETPGVIEVNDVKARIHGPEIIIDLKICVDGAITVEAGHDIAAATARRVRRAVDHVADVLVHVNPCRREPDPELGGYTCSACNIRMEE